ncbi:Fur family ferric uptake transcriptional regulator [Mucilaginibacter oryzae]|uniref:Fur family ferric uptake transcriptional regulator n=1 Tax=Mucilaginibacter oryzae TaxID=468058 RepID=A0A316HQU1_9SPHI|nr:transcriptional repressor [Mucilaginibacter oryzae]PWK77242.1 Fur family ferric uptake transcriptional regulator [Mucilaginibacter oryzae]
MGKDFTGLLQKNHLHVTAPRLSVLELIDSRESATSQPYLEKNINQGVDRVTLYRILKTFEEKGILHKVIDANGTANYAMCSEDCREGHHHDEHVHFNCTNCQQLYCLRDFELPPLKLPPGYTAENINMLISGVCEHCKGSI